MSSPAVVLLGPQRIDPVVRGATAAPDVGVVLAELGVRRRVALITAGWQEREADDELLVVVAGVVVDVVPVVEVVVTIVAIPYAILVALILPFSKSRAIKPAREAASCACRPG